MPSVTVIGDITIDNFISLSDEYVQEECDLQNENCKLILPFGGKVPVKDVEIHCGGNAANVAVGLKKLDIDVTPIIPLGKDSFSNIALANLSKEGIQVSHETIDESYKCNSAYIFKFKDDRTIFTHHEKKDYPIYDEIKTPYVYYSSHSGDNNSLSTKLLTTIQRSKTKLIFAPANTQLDGDKSILEALISKSFLLICNKTEAYKMLTRLDESEINQDFMLHRLHHLGAKHVVITNGANGVYFLDGETEETKHLDSEINQESIVDSTGAGDSVCTGVIYGLINNMSLEDGVKVGLKNAASVLMSVGSQTGLLRKDEI